MPDFRGYPLTKPPPRHDHRGGSAFMSLCTSLPAPPQSVDWYSEVEAAGGWWMLGNDLYGDCAEAAVMHGAMLRTRYAGRALVAETSDATGLYSRVTGFDPARPSTDVGTQVAALLDYCARNQFSVGPGSDQLQGFVPLDPTNPLQIRQAIALTGSVLLGVRFPAAWRAGGVWDAVDGPDDGGHAVLLAGYDAAPGAPALYHAITWGYRLGLTEAGLLQRADEAWAVLDWDWLAANGVDPAGQARADYVAALDALRG